MLQKSGLYLHIGPEGHVLAVVVEDIGKQIWIRNFATIESALNVLEDEILEGLDRNSIEAELSKGNGYFADLDPRANGYKDHAFVLYKLTHY